MYDFFHKPRDINRFLSELREGDMAAAIPWLCYVFENGTAKIQDQDCWIVRLDAHKTPGTSPKQDGKGNLVSNHHSGVCTLLVVKRGGELHAYPFALPWKQIKHQLVKDSAKNRCPDDALDVILHQEQYPGLKHWDNGS